MSEEEFNPGVGRIRGKKDGTNWVMFAGGAIAMAVSVAFGRRKLLEEGAVAKGALITSESGKVQASHQEGDENGSLQSSEMVPDGTLRWSNTQLALPSTEAAFEFRSFKPKRPAPTDASPPVAKFIRQSSVSPELSQDEVIQFDTQISSTLQSGVIARRSEVVSRLRQQIKSRDAIIHDMQTQLADQDQMIAVHRNHSIDLQDCVQAIRTKLFEANLEIQRLQRELMTQHAKSIVDLDEEFIDYSVPEIRQPWVHPKDVEEIILETKKLNEEVEHLRRESEAKEKVAQATSRQCELLVKRLSVLTTELKELETAAHGKQRLLESKEQECLKLADVVQDLQRKLEIEARGKESQETSMSMNLVMKRADVPSIKLGHNVDRPITPPTYEEVPSTFAYHRAGNVRKPGGSVPVRDGREESATRGEPRCLFGGYRRKREAPGDQDGRMADPENNGMIDESLILKFEYEVDQLASALALTSKVVLEKVQDAKQQELEGEINELTKHQVKLAELKSLMTKITAKFNAPNIDDDAFVFDLERKLAAQEMLAKETSLIVQQLSTSPHLSSPCNPPVQEAWRTVQDTPRSPFSHNMHKEHTVVGSSDENSRNAPPEENSSQTWERQGFLSALRSFNQNGNKNTDRLTLSPMRPLERPYQFQLVGFDSVPAATSRALARVGSIRQPNSVENQPSHRVRFRPDPETTSGFSFGHYITEGAEQGDRMSSPEPEPISHRFPAFNPSPEPSITPALTERSRVNYSGSEFRLSPGFNSLVNTLAHGEPRYSPLTQLGSPCFGISKEEPNFRLSRHLFKSPPPSISGLDDTTTVVREVNFSISEREQETSEDRAKIKRLIGGKKPHSGGNQNWYQNSATPSTIGVSPFAARMEQLKVGSLGSLDKGQGLQEDEEDVGWGPVGKERHLFNKNVEALCQSIANLDAQDGGKAMRESRDSSGSCNPDEPVVLLQSLLRRSNESSNERH